MKPSAPFQRENAGSRQVFSPPSGGGRRGAAAWGLGAGRALPAALAAAVLCASLLPAPLSLAQTNTNSKFRGGEPVTLNFVNADGRAIMPPIEIPVEVALPDDAYFLTRNFIINIQQLKFTEAGLYSVDLRLDGESRANIPLQVKNPPPRPEA